MQPRPKRPSSKTDSASDRKPHAAYRPGIAKERVASKQGIGPITPKRPLQGSLEKLELPRVGGLPNPQGLNDAQTLHRNPKHQDRINASPLWSDFVKTDRLPLPLPPGNQTGELACLGVITPDTVSMNGMFRVWVLDSLIRNRPPRHVGQRGFHNTLGPNSYHEQGLPNPLLTQKAPWAPSRFEPRPD